MKPVTLLMALVVTACSSRAGTEERNFTLYRNSPSDETMRIHVATFDARYEKDGHNRENCEQARKLFQAQPGVRAKYWCEVGIFHK